MNELQSHQAIARIALLATICLSILCTSCTERTQERVEHSLTSFRFAEHGEGMRIYAITIHDLDVAVYLPRHMTLSEPQFGSYIPTSQDYGWDRMTFTISSEEQAEISSILNRNRFWTAESESNHNIMDGTQWILVGNVYELDASHACILNNSFPPNLVLLHTELLDAIQLFAESHQPNPTPVPESEIETVFAWPK